MKKISILGCGWLGLPLAKSLIEKGFSIKGSTTSEEKLQVLQNAGIQPFLISIKFDKVVGDVVNFLNESDQNLDSKFWDFDIFSAVFYLASRYEEYGGFTPDAHQRFPPEASILHKTESFEFPLINLWVKELKEALLLKWPELIFKEPT